MKGSLDEALKILNASSDINVKVKDNTIVIEWPLDQIFSLYNIFNM